MMENSKISFVIPVYNNPDCLEEIVTMALKAVSDEHCLAEIIFINDGSADESWNSICQLAEKYKDIVYGLDLMRNYGQHHATLCGIQRATGDFIITLDDDLTHSPQQAMQLLHFMLSENLDLAYGISAKRKSGIGRSIGRYMLYLSSSVGSKRIAGASFRAMTATLAKEMNPEGDVIFIDDILTSVTDRYHYKTFENFRNNKQSRYSNKSLLKMGINISLFYSGFPLRLLSFTGFAGSLISGVFGLFYLYKKLFFKVPMGYTSIIVAVLFSASAMLLGMGILGKYLYRIHGNRNRVLPYHVRKTTKDA